MKELLLGYQMRNWERNFLQKEITPNRKKDDFIEG
jgi:hypothetical protein